MTDRDLLISYQQSNSPEHFSQLVTAHINLVYSVALRQTRSDHLAEDITQEVFLLLSRKAQTLKPDIPLAGWLFTTARFLSLQALRANSRRAHHETEAAMSHQPPADPDPLWPLIAKDIDQAVADLPSIDRDALLLRYFNHKSTSEIAAALAISEEAAKKRVQRALDALEKLLTSRGFATTTAALLAAALTTHAVRAAPPTLATSITTALTTKAAAALATKGTLMAAAKLKATLIAAAALALIAIPTSIYLSTRNSPTAAAPTGAVIPVAAEPSTTPDAAGPAPTDYFAVYALPPGQVIANLTHIDPVLRTALYQQNAAPSQVRAMEQTPSGMIIQWKGGQLSLWSMNWSRNGIPDETLPLRTILDIYTPEIVSPFPLPALPGDLVFRVDATEREYLASLEIILTSYFKRPINCSIRVQPMEAVVLSGTYHFTPVATDHGAGDPTSDLEFYLHDLNPGLGSGNGGRVNSSREFAGTLSEYVGKPVIVNAAGFPKRVLYGTNVGLDLLSPDDAALFLQHIADQTGLTVTHETRPIRCLVIETQNKRIVAPSWQGYPRLSPFQAVRWNVDVPEVQVPGDPAWYQLLSINSIPAADIIAFAQKSDSKDWQRRFEEDFVALLSLMQKPPAATAILSLKNLQTGETHVIDNAPLTEENRKAIHNALVARETPPTK